MLCKDARIDEFSVLIFPMVLGGASICSATAQNPSG